MNEFENTKVTENEDTQDWNPDLMNEEEHTTDTFDVVVEKTEEKSNEDSTFAAESDNADESAETTPNDDTSDREIQCAACGNISKQRNWFLSRIGTHYVICPKCGTLRYVYSIYENCQKRTCLSISPFFNCWIHYYINHSNNSGPAYIMALIRRNYYVTKKLECCYVNMR